jgi:hypothetical protein
VGITTSQLQPVAAVPVSSSSYFCLFPAC